MYVTRRDIGVINALPYFQQSKIGGRKTVRSDGRVQRRRLGNSIPKLVKWSMLTG